MTIEEMESTISKSSYNESKYSIFYRRESYLNIKNSSLDYQILKKQIHIDFFDFISLVCGRQPWKSVMHPPKNNRVKRIVNGGEADYGEWPWYVQLQKKRKSRLPLPIGILKHITVSF